MLSVPERLWARVCHSNSSSSALEVVVELLPREESVSGSSSINDDSVTLSQMLGSLLSDS